MHHFCDLYVVFNYFLMHVLKSLWSTATSSATQQAMVVCDRCTYTVDIAYKWMQCIGQVDGAVN